MSERSGVCACGCGKPTKLAKKTDSKRGVVKGQPNIFLKGHHIVEHNRTEKRAKGPAYLVDANGCWIWQRYVNPQGYGMMRVPDGPVRVAHRVFYEQRVGPIPVELVIDHLCRVRNCVNPAHLEPVTIRENILRGNGMGARYARRRRGEPDVVA